MLVNLGTLQYYRAPLICVLKFSGGSAVYQVEPALLWLLLWLNLEFWGEKCVLARIRMNSG